MAEKASEIAWEKDAMVAGRVVQFLSSLLNSVLIVARSIKFSD